MLKNREYAQIITALFYGSDGVAVPLATVNSLLRMYTYNPGVVTISAETKTLAISEPIDRPSFFSRLWPKGLFAK